jgi:hypothetical protein
MLRAVISFVGACTQPVSFVLVAVYILLRSERQKREQNKTPSSLRDMWLRKYKRNQLPPSVGKLQHKRSFAFRGALCASLGVDPLTKKEKEKGEE